MKCKYCSHREAEKVKQREISSKCGRILYCRHTYVCPLCKKSFIKISFESLHQEVLFKAVIEQLPPTEKNHYKELL